MVNLALVEIKSRTTRNQNPSSSTNTNNASSEVIVRKQRQFGDNKIVIKDITKEITFGHYNLKEEFTIIFLYDFMNDPESRNFIITNGGSLHTHSSSNMTILTYFESDMVNKWTNVQFRNNVLYDSDHDGFKVMQIIKNLQNYYNVKKIPAMVIVRKDSNDDEEYCNIDLSSYKKEALYNTFKATMEIIKNNCEEEFSVIVEKLCGPEYKVKEKIDNDDFNLFNFIEDLIKKEKKLKHIKFTQLDLSKELNFDVRTLHNKRKNNSFTRDECLYLAIRFSISIQKLNKLLRKNNHIDIGIGGRDGIIRSGLLNKFNVKVINIQLINQGYDGIIFKKE
jgi:hypothetical protein